MSGTGQRIVPGGELIKIRGSNNCTIVVAHSAWLHGLDIRRRHPKRARALRGCFDVAIKVPKRLVEARGTIGPVVLDDSNIAIVPTGEILLSTMGDGESSVVVEDHLEAAF